MTLPDFLKILVEAVRNQKDTGNDWERLQTFAQIRYEYDMNAENLEKTPWHKNKGVFYSRKWERQGKSPSNIIFEFPALLAQIYTVEKENPFAVKKKPDCFRIRLMTLYPNYNKSDYDKRTCTRIVVEEIYPLMNKLMNSVFDYIKGVVYADVDGTNQWGHKDYFAALQADGKITTYAIDNTESLKFQNRMNRNNPNTSGDMIDDSGTNMLCGISQIITFCEKDCTASTFDFDLTNCCEESK